MTRTLPRKALTAAAALVVLAAGSGGCGTLLGGGQPAAVVIGADLALTGPGSPLGTVYHQALMLRVEQLNRQRLPDHRQLHLRVRDNRSDPQVAAANLAELASDPQVSAVVSGACGACAARAAETLAAHQVPAIALTGDDRVATPVDQRRYLFKLGPNAGDGADLLSAELARPPAGTVALVTGTTSYTGDGGDAGGYGDAGRREMTAAAGRGGFEIVAHHRLAGDGQAGAAAAAAAIAGWQPADAPFGAAAAGPDAVVIWTGAEAAGRLAAALRAAGYRGRLLLDAVAAGDLYLPGDALTGARLVFTPTPVADQVIAATPAQAARQAWFRDYLAQYGTYHAQASWAADAAGVIADAVRRTDIAAGGGAAGPVDRDALRDQIESTRRLDGLTGLIRYSADQHSGLHPESLTTLVAGAGRWHPAG